MPGGVVSFGTQTHPADGTAGMVVAAEDRARELSGGAGVARILATGFARVEKGRMPKAPVPAARQALADAGLDIGAIDVIKTHNPFAVNDVWFAREMGVDAEAMNPYGSSLVYGHPQAPTGARGIAELIEILRRRGGGPACSPGAPPATPVPRPSCTSSRPEPDCTPVNHRDYADQDGVGLAALVRAGEVTADEVEEATRRAIEAVEAALHATVGELLDCPPGPDGHGPLAGVPFGLKDTAPHLEGQVVQLAAAGPVTVSGSLRTRTSGGASGPPVSGPSPGPRPEFAFNATTEPIAHGPTHNPWDLARSVGGSSGGSAALVAARALPIAHATDAAGSIRIPAALCGVVGLKPTRARIPIPPGAWEAVHGLSHDFVIARTLRDVATTLDALTGRCRGTST